MAFKNKEIYNSKTGQGFKFIQTRMDTNGSLLEMESLYSSLSKEPPAHYHPYQTEDFIVLEGELTVRINGKLKTLKKDEALHIEPNVVHAMWNASERKTIVNWKVRPALNTEYLLETTVALAVNNKTNETGRPAILQIAVTMLAFSDTFRLAKPFFALQKVIFLLLTPFSYLFGYRPTYKEYLD